MNYWLLRTLQPIRIAWADMVHNSVLSLCVLFALIAVVSPILFLFGLKNGEIETQRTRLLNNPYNLEIRPTEGLRLRPEWFAKMRANEEQVTFVVPAVNGLASRVTASLVSAGGSGEDMDVVPTQPHDPLLEKNHASVPDDGAVTLSAMAADKLGAKKGDRLTLTVLRAPNGVPETAQTVVTVASVADLRASPLEQIFAPLKLVEAIERFKGGHAVPSLKWSGDVGAVTPVFDQAVCLINGDLTSDEQKGALSNTGLSTIEKIDAAACLRTCGVQPGPNRFAYLVGTERSVLDPESLDALKTLWSARAICVIPICKPLVIDVGTGTQSEPVTIKVLPDPNSVPAPDTVTINPVQPWTGQRILLPPGRKLSGTIAQLPDSKSPLTFPLTVDTLPGVTGPEAWAPSDFVGSMRAAQLNAVTYEPEVGVFIPAKDDYFGFRLYARTLDDVAPLRTALLSEGISVVTQLKAIDEVKALDQALTQIFWILAGVGTLGAAATQGASLYSAVIRQRRELSVLKLLGVGSLSLLLYPITQAITLATASFLGAWGVVLGAGEVTDYVFRDKLEPGETFLHLSPLQLGVFYALICGLALVASLLAGLYVFTIDIAEGLRDE